MNMVHRKPSLHSPRDGLDFRIEVIIFLSCLVWLLLLAGGKPSYDPDGGIELHIAQNVANGHGIVANIVSMDDPAPISEPWITKPPLLPLAVALLVLLGLPIKLAGLTVSLVACAAAAVFLYLIARHALPRVPAALVSLLFASQIVTARWGISVHEEALFVSLSFATLWRITKLQQIPHPAHWGEYVFVGVLAALAMLASYQGLPLLLVSAGYMAWLAHRAGRWALFSAFAAGVAVTAAWPFLRFIRLWLEGSRPGFDISNSTAYYEMLAGFASSFQNDVLGSQFIWLYNGSLLDVVVLSGFYLLLVILFAFVFLKSPGLRPLVLYVALYLVMLVVQLGGWGKNTYEPRISMPVYGPLFILALYALNVTMQGWKKLRLVGLGLGTLALTFFVYGQINRLPDLMAGHGSFCPSPETIGWVKAHIPEGAVIAAGQCGHELSAESASYYWLPIPPARDPRDDHRRWTESDFVKSCRQIGVRWIVLLTGKTGDPFRDNPGYGPFVEQLFSSQPSTHTELVAKLTDGLVYRLHCGAGDNAKQSQSAATVSGPPS